MKKPCVLLILDGWGKAAPGPGNAVSQARTPRMEALLSAHPKGELKCMGRDVGLPDGQMGNSEVGHLNLGAGRIVYQDIMRINLAIEDGSLAANPVLAELAGAAKGGSGRVHLMGLVSDGGVHSMQDHLVALIQALSDQGVADICVHAFLDGRDTPPRSGLGYIKALEADLARIGAGRIVSVSGRYYAMDRDQRWDRVELAYAAMTDGRGLTAPSAVDAVSDGYEAGENDEFVKPRVILRDGRPSGLIEDGDAVLFFNFRADRARELTRALNEDGFTGFARPRKIALSRFVTMTRYEKDFGLPVLFPPVSLDRILGQVVSERGMRQLRTAETEKYAHVTYFFNGGQETPFPGEDRELLPSPKDVPTYDFKPEMSVYKVTDTLVKALESGNYDMVICNFANLDMVGHTGVIPAAIKACEAVDQCLGRVMDCVVKMGGTLLVTADHGNAEDMLDAQGNVKTSHSLNPVPFVYLGPGNFRVRDGRLADVAPTILAILGIEKPVEMTGESLLLPL
ncbi:2,3-bisphosphoglycerate-independent phosphoglycerate mutase [Desulfomicrobium macestii]|uniref:2,3-bisphosphoglycerate-independent phosphoglycerate mutase n=1 Tax=Desulfomicrobium macestii TaxID=90731 RepID=A0ABR9H2X7_9BACT|nr:2,3-bisphosphoglycerate-independent phosphoglycerate mutase [Desulfomicrobium macestii]MBE1425044.1 2,3-bisphosphoglycerate-independent phosphoglycerate mutase [Desulfomicrobium macestii]